MKVLKSCNTMYGRTASYFTPYFEFRLKNAIPFIDGALVDTFIWYLFNHEKSLGCRANTNASKDYKDMIVKFYSKHDSKLDQVLTFRSKKAFILNVKDRAWIKI